MIKYGDYILCKKTFYLDDYNFLDKISNRLFGKSIFKKHKKYKVVRIEQRMYKDTNEYYESYFINISFHTLNIDFDVECPKPFIDKYFYTENEIRKIKLKKLKK